MILNQSKGWMHYNPVRAHSMPGGINKIHKFIPPDGKILLVTTGGFTRRGSTKLVIDQFDPKRIIVFDQVTPNPQLDDLDFATSNLKKKDIRHIVAIGGGSVIDAAKVLSVTLLHQSDRPLNDVLRNGKTQNWECSLPIVAVPTTSGTGAEVTPFATVWDTKNRKKHSLTDEKLYPIHAILDPTLTLSLPRQTTLYTSLDAISHALESLWNKNRTPISEAYAIRALTLANSSLPVILEEPYNLQQRAAMQEASLLAGLAISETRTAIAHSISYPLTSYHGIPHGLACSFTLPAIFNVLMHSDKHRECVHKEINTTVELLKSLDLRSEILKYVDIQAIQKLEKEMLFTGRSDNFVLSPTTDLISEVLKQSLEMMK